MKPVMILVSALLIVYLALLATLPWPARRRLRHGATFVLGALGALIALVPLGLLLAYLIKNGLPYLDISFFTRPERPYGEPGGGFLNAIVGSLIIVGLASCIGIPVGMLAGIYLNEIGRKGKMASALRFLSEVLTGLPSIIAGILGYTLIVVRYQQPSAWAAALALSVLMIPIITRVTEEALKLVPNALREASYALGIGQWRTVWHVALPAAKSAILTGVVLAVARVGGETAPLLFTAFGRMYLSFDPSQSMSALPLSIYNRANQPAQIDQNMAIAGALVLVLWISAVNLIVRWIAARSEGRRAV